MTNAERIQAEIGYAERAMNSMRDVGYECRPERIGLAAMRVCKALEEMYAHRRMPMPENRELWQKWTRNAITLDEAILEARAELMKVLL
jgi:hypothetical protein